MKDDDSDLKLQETMEALKASILKTLEYTMPCVLCAKETMDRGVHFGGDASETIGAPPGKSRVIIYGICPECVKVENAEKLVGEALVKQIREIQEEQDAGFFPPGKRSGYDN